MSHRRLVRRALSVAACWGVALGFAGAVQTAGAKAGGVVDLPVSFKVKNTNSSDMPCASDGARYTVRGHLVAPRSALDARGRRAITVYLHGFNVGAFMWRLPGFPQLDLPAALARLGHVSLVVDELGYDRSDH